MFLKKVVTLLGVFDSTVTKSMCFFSRRTPTLWESTLWESTVSRATDFGVGQPNPCSPILDLGKHTLDWAFFIVKTVLFAKMSPKLELSLDVFEKR